jgi:Domain of unknown function (DUF4132)
VSIDPTIRAAGQSFVNFDEPFSTSLDENCRMSGAITQAKNPISWDNDIGRRCLGVYGSTLSCGSVVRSAEQFERAHRKAFQHQSMGIPKEFEQFARDRSITNAKSLLRRSYDYADLIVTHVGESEVLNLIVNTEQALLCQSDADLARLREIRAEARRRVESGQGDPTEVAYYQQGAFADPTTKDNYRLWKDHTLSSLVGLRNYFACTPNESTYKSLVEELRIHLESGEIRPIVFAFLFPTEKVSVQIADENPTEAMLWSGASNIPTSPYEYFLYAANHPMIYSLLHRFGLDLWPVLAIDPQDGNYKTRRAFVLSRIDTDDAFRELLLSMNRRAAIPYVNIASDRQPERAARLLAEITKGKLLTEATSRLSQLRVSHPTLFGEKSSNEMSAPKAPIASTVTLPEALQTESKRAFRQLEVTAIWRPETQWVNRFPHYYPLSSRSPLFRRNRLESILKERDLKRPELHSYYQTYEDELRQLGSEKEIVDRLVKSQQASPTDLLYASEWAFETLVGLVPSEPDGLDHVIGARGAPGAFSEPLEQFALKAIQGSSASFQLVGQLGSSLLAGCAARALKSKSSRGAATSWILAFPKHAAAGLIAAALGPKGPGRDEAGRALRLLDHHGYRSAVDEAIVNESPEVKAAVLDLLDADSFTSTVVVRLPKWLLIESLPPVSLRNSSGVLPVEAVQQLLSLLAKSTIDESETGLVDAIESLDRSSLDDFLWKLFGLWLTAGSPSAHEWILEAQTFLITNPVVASFASQIESWVRQSRASRVKSGLTVLETIGTPLSLVRLFSLGQRIQHEQNSAHAQLLLEQHAARLSISLDEMFDRLIPELNLDARRGCRIDFGPRVFWGKFDAALAPYLEDDSGRTIRSLPKPAKTDDLVLTQESTTLWKSVRESMSPIARAHIDRIERAMATGRRWTLEEFDRLFVGVPVFAALMRSVVWSWYHDDALLQTFRFSEDSSLADIDDHPTTVPLKATHVAIAHRLDLGEGDTGRWGSLFTDYQIFQPIKQLGRPCFIATPQEAGSAVLSRFEQVPSSSYRVNVLTQRGWNVSSRDGWATKTLSSPESVGSDRSVSVGPGNFIGMVHLAGATFGDLTAREFTEICYDVSLMEVVVA